MNKTLNTYLACHSHDAYSLWNALLDAGFWVAGGTEEGIEARFSTSATASELLTVANASSIHLRSYSPIPKAGYR